MPAGATSPGVFSNGDTSAAEVLQSACRAGALLHPRRLKLMFLVVLRVLREPGLLLEGAVSGEERRGRRFVWRGIWWWWRSGGGGVDGWCVPMYGRHSFRLSPPTSNLHSTHNTLPPPPCPHPTSHMPPSLLPAVPAWSPYPDVRLRDVLLYRMSGSWRWEIRILRTSPHPSPTLLAIYTAVRPSVVGC